MTQGQLAAFRDRELQLLKDAAMVVIFTEHISPAAGFCLHQGLKEEKEEAIVIRQEREEILTELKSWDEEIAWKKYAVALQ